MNYAFTNKLSLWFIADKNKGTYDGELFEQLFKRRN